MTSHDTSKSVDFQFIDTQATFDALFGELQTSSPVIAIDAERASSFRYTSKAYLVQIKVGKQSAIVFDPINLTDFNALTSSVHKSLVLIHSATQDLECLRELGIAPQHLFDTELAAKLLGKPKVGLQALLESELGIRIEKEHSAVDWSKRPLPEDWLIYAAQDVEHLQDLYEVLEQQLTASTRMTWAHEEFEFLAKWQPKVISDKWRRTSGLHKVKQRRHLAAVMHLWEARDEIAASNDLAPSRVLRDEALVEIALSKAGSAQDIATLLKQRFRVRFDYSAIWWNALDASQNVAEEELPVFHQKNPNGLPPIKAWQEKNPAAAERFGRTRSEVLRLAESLGIAPEVVINPETIRQVSWHFDHWDDEFFKSELIRMQTRHWQIELLFEDLFESLRHD